MISKEYIIYCDESIEQGTYYSNFYGGALIRSPHLNYIIKVLNDKKENLNLFGEVKWQKVSSNYLEKYILLMDEFFNLIQADKIKIRIMFTQNCHIPCNLEQYHKDNQYFLLYYQFIKHAFGLQYSNSGRQPINVRIYFDKLPDTNEKNALFKDFIYGLNRYRTFQKVGIKINREQLAEVESHKHVILQCLDVVLGSMQFYLNDKHKNKPKGSRRRGKRTIAKEKLYKHINRRIRIIYPYFNIGITTGTKDITNFWVHPYRHWRFMPKGARFDETKTK